MNKLTNYTTEKIFTRLLTNKSSSNWWNYVSELRKRATEGIFKKSLSLANSNVITEKEIGLTVLAQFGYPRVHKKEILKFFFKLLERERDRRILSPILYGIGHSNEKLTIKQINILCTFKTHKSTTVRHALVFALCTLENAKAIDALIYLSNDKDSDVRDWATFGLGTQIEIDNEKIRTALWDRVSDKDEGPRFEAISGLAQRRDYRIKNILTEELERIDEHGSLILEAIEQLEDKTFITLLEKKIIENRKTRTINEEWLLKTLEKLRAL
ncbi:MAG: HEAT repeat domain-containing protein [Saprospiraceae bacterium]